MSSIYLALLGKSNASLHSRGPSPLSGIRVLGEGADAHGLFNPIGSDRLCVHQGEHGHGTCARAEGHEHREQIDAGATVLEPEQQVSRPSMRLAAAHIDQAMVRILKMGNGLQNGCVSYPDSDPIRRRTRT